MTNETQIQIFNNDTFGQLRVILFNGEPMFIGKEVALVLGYNDTLHERFEDKDNTAFTFEKGITREEIRETNHKLRAQIRKQLNIQEDLDKQDQEN